MDIRKIDRNMEQTVVDGGGMKLYKMPCEPFTLYGVKHDERGFYRLDDDFAASVSDGVKYLARNTAGGRIRFKTDSKTLKAIVKYKNFCRMGHMPLSGSGGLSLTDVTDDEWVFKGLIRPEHNCERGYEGSVKLSGEMREYILWLPLYNDVDELTIGLDEGAAVEKGGDYAYGGKPIVYYGSSITQGGCASRPDNAYEALISKHTDNDFINLGFSGSAKGETAVAKYAAALNPLIFVIDYDHNAPDAEYLRSTHYAFYKAFREENKTAPIVFVTRPDFDSDEASASRRAVVKETCEKAKSVGDDVYFVDGQTLFGELDRENCTVDGYHPNDLGFYRMSEVIGSAIREILAKIK